MAMHNRHRGFEKPRPGGIKALGRAFTYLRSEKWLQMGAFFSLFFVLAANLMVPQAVRLAVDGGLAKHAPQAVIQAVTILLGAALVRGLFSFLQQYLSERASQDLAFTLRDALFAKIQRLSFSYFDQVQTGQLVTRLTNDVEQIRSFLGSSLISLAQSIIMLIGSIGLLLAINRKLTFVSLATLLPIFVVLALFIRRVGPLFGKVQQALGRLNSLLQQDLQGLRIIRAYGRETDELARYKEANDGLLDQNLVTIRAMAGTFPFIFFFANLGTLAVVSVGGFEVLGGHLTVGELLAFNSYLGFLIHPIMMFGFLAAGVSRAGASALRIFEVLDAPEDVTNMPDAHPLPPVQGRVSFENVHFRYPGSEREVLRGINFSVEPGETVAVLGTTGSGKSTLVTLLPRFYDTTSGSVLIDGNDIREVTLASLRSQIGIVMQDALLFGGTVRDNIAYGRPEASMEEVIAVAEAAQADSFIQSLPQGYDTLIGERGVGLSGGQRQRIAIARALLIDPRLLILDDSTSAVDAETEAAIQVARDRLLRDKKRTAFVIAQRISTVRGADRVLVLDEGQIVAQGTHEALLETSPIYRDILGSQLEEVGGMA